MGNYYLFVDIERKEYFRPTFSCKLGEMMNPDATKMLMEFVTMVGWESKRIVKMVGDESQPKDYAFVIENYKDISETLLKSLMEDGYVKRDRRRKYIWQKWKFL